MRRSTGLTTGLSLLFAAPLAVADVPLPGTQPAEFQEDPYEPLFPAQGCSGCHADIPDEPFAPFNSWSGSMMGNAARDPVFLAALSVAEDDHPGGGDFCLRCHAPEAWLEGRSTPSDGSALRPDDDGVTCHFCHRLTDADPIGNDLNAPYIGNARFFITPETRMRGPYDDVTTAEHDTVQSDYHSDQRFCGLCHDISNPLVPWRDEDGNELGPEFPIERTYTEWLRSAFATEGTTCQSCHMPAFEGKACNLSLAPTRPDVYSHELIGGNAWVPRALTYLYDEQLERADEWAVTEARAVEMLQSAATLSFEEIPDSVETGEALALSVRVTNNAGHRLPTGYPEGRRMWLEVTVADADGDTVLASGTYDEDEAERLEDEQLRAYEIELGVAGEGPGFHFIRNDVIYRDTRIPPRGFVPDPSDSGVLPVGRDYGDGAGGYRHYDVAPYATNVGCATGPLTVTVRLLQQTSSREYIEFLRDNQAAQLGIDRGATLYDAWEQTGKSTPVVMGELTQTIVVAGTPCEPDADGDADADTDGDADVDADGDTDADADADGSDEGGCCTVTPGAGGDGQGALLAVVGGLLVVLHRFRSRRRRDG